MPIVLSVIQWSDLCPALPLAFFRQHTTQESPLPIHLLELVIIPAHTKDGGRFLQPADHQVAAVSCGITAPFDHVAAVPVT